MKEGEGTSSPLSIRRRPADWAPYGHVIVRLVTSFSIHSIQLCWRSALCRWWPSSPSISYIRSRSTVTTGISDICFLLSYLLSSCQHQRSNSGRQDIIEAHAFLSAILPLQQFLNWLPCQLVTAARTFKGGSVGTTWMKPRITQSESDGRGRRLWKSSGSFDRDPLQVICQISYISLGRRGKEKGSI